MNRDRTSIIDKTASALLVVFGSALAATALFFVIEWDVYIAVLVDSDPRPKVEVIEELRSAGHDAWPIAPPASLARAFEGKDSPVDLFPAIAALPDLMAVSRTPRTHYNELGYDLVAREIAVVVTSHAARNRRRIPE